MPDPSSADLTNPIVLDQLIGLAWEKYRRGHDLSEKRKAAGPLGMYAMLLRMEKEPNK